MNTHAPTVSDYDLVRKMLARLTRIEQSRRVTANEIRIVQTIRKRWENDGESFALAPTVRENLVSMVRKVETRLKAHPYPRFY